MSILNKMTAWFKAQQEAVRLKASKIDMKQKIEQSNWIEKSKQSVQDSLIKSKNLICAHKKAAILSVATLFTIVLGAGVGHTYYQANMETIYHVYLHGKEIGIVNNKDVINKWVDDKLNEESTQFSHVKLDGNSNLVFNPEESYKPQYNNEAALKKLETEFSLKADALEVVIDGEFIGYVANEETLSTILDSYKREFVSEEILATINNSTIEKKNVVSIASVNEEEEGSVSGMKESEKPPYPLNKPQVIDAKIKQEIQLEHLSVHPSLVLNADQLKETLAGSKEEEMTHEVQEGEVLGTIAEKYGLKIKEVIALNPGLKEDTLLQIGQKLTVKGNEPLITVQTVEKLIKEEEIKYTLDTKQDAKLYQGESRVEQEGKNGKLLVEYTITKENGKVVDKTIDHEEIMTKPVNKIIVRGTKKKPSRGEGTFSWPAVGGFVTSGYGQRWGRLHGGMDISGVGDRTIKAADNGKVTTAGWDRYFGNYVIINHGNGYETLYAHMSSLSVSKGDVVKKGEKLGVMGSTGSSTGVHLHFEVHKNGKRVNPINYVKR